MRKLLELDLKPKYVIQMAQIDVTQVHAGTSSPATPS